MLAVAKDFGIESPRRGLTEHSRQRDLHGGGATGVGRSSGRPRGRAALHDDTILGDVSQPTRVSRWSDPAFSDRAFEPCNVPPKQ
jgi:hypothetical protein